MDVLFRPVLFFFVLISLFFSSSAQTCSDYSFSNNRAFNSCNALPVLNAFLHWTYNESSGAADIAYRHTSITTSRWVAWSINPSASGMLGAQALVAVRGSDGAVRAYTSSVTSYGTQLSEGNLSFVVRNIEAVYANNEITIFATLFPPSTTVNQVWQDGPLSGDTPGAHAMETANRQSLGSLNFLSGQTTATGVVIPRLKRKNVHGVLNAVSWGTLMPLGIIIARYLKVVKSADPAWFYLHIFCQSSAYIIGVAGWATGLKLGSESSIPNEAHRNIGITMFCLATLQVFALLLRPKPDHKFRFYWNIYHHVTGYTVIILSIVNVFKGLDILDPEKKWKKIYIGVLLTLGVIAVQLEALTWFIVIKRKKNAAKPNHDVNGANGVNGYGARPQQVV